MIRFIDITTGNVFNGSQPYVFWFDKEQSVNLNYVRKICVLSTDEYLTVSLPENLIFCLLDTTQMGEDIELSGKKFKDLDNSGFKTYEFNSVGAPYEDFYVHMLYILGHSAESGEFREELTIGNETFTIGADFYNEREELSISLSNQGLEMPKVVEKAIYEFNVHEEGVDNILLNRKYKELLSEYINVLGNKGSYKSLINSINWFEYGDLINALDYWKHEEPTRTIYSGEPIKQVVDKDIEDILTKLHKTTYIGLYLALTRTSLDADGNIRYVDSVKYWDDVINSQYGVSWESATTQKLMSDLGETIITDSKDRLLQIGEDHILVDDYPESTATPLPFSLPYTIGQGGSWPALPEQGSNWKLLDRYFDDQGHVICREIPEPVPAIDFAAAKWSAIDLSLKMTMLGNFFSTYFMPLHLDLIHSTVENIVYANTIKFFAWHALHRQDWNHDIESFSCDVENKDYYITDVRARVYPDTTFGDQYEEGKKSFNIFGVEKEDKKMYACAIVVGSDVLDRNESEDRKYMGTDYYAWNNYYTITPEPEEGDAVYAYDLLSGFMTEVGVVENVVEDGGYVFDNDTVKTYLSQRFEGPGAIVPFKCILHNVQHGIYITEASIIVSHNGEDRLHHTYNIHNNVNEVNEKPQSILLSNNETLQRNIDGDVEVDDLPYYCWGEVYTLYDVPSTGDKVYKIEDNEMVLTSLSVIKAIYVGDRHINFNILLQDIGDYQFTVDFKCGSGMHYIKKFNFSVYDDTRQETKMYKVSKRDWDEMANIIPADKEDLLKFMFTQLDVNDSVYRQFLATNDSAFLDKLGLNQIIIYEPQIQWNGDNDPLLTYRLKIGNKLLNVANRTYDNVKPYLESFVETLNANTKYRFFLQDRLGLKVDKICDTFQPDPLIPQEEYTPDNWNVIKYNNSKNIAYLYDIIQRHENESGIEQYYAIIPYIFGICLQFDTQKDLILISDGKVGVVKDGQESEATYKVHINVDSGWKLSVDTTSDQNNPVEVLVKTAVKRNTPRHMKRPSSVIYDMVWRKPSQDLYQTYIIDNVISLRFVWANTGVTKDIDIKVSDLINFGYVKKVLNIEGKYCNCIVPSSSRILSKIDDKSINNNNVGRLYLRHKFVPIFHTFKEVPDRTIENNDVVCFLPDLTMVRNDQYNPIGWSFTNVTTHESIQPLPYKRKDLYWDDPDVNPNKKDKLVDPLEPLLGRYDLKKIIDPGYYNVELEYELITDHNIQHKYKSNSEFIVKK